MIKKIESKLFCHWSH